ncbi:hypothetical protein EBS40_06030 [bacterium]|nr:hypothetical protein [bacterium]
MKVYIDGENLRKSLARVLLDSKAIKNSRDLTTYHLRNLLQDILATKDLDIHYYSSEIRLPNGYTPSDEIMSHVESIRSYSRKWVPNLKLQNITYVKAGYLKVKSTKPCQVNRAVSAVASETITIPAAKTKQYLK